MVDRGNADKHRTGITGNGLGKVLSKVVETEKWGHDTAIKRYGKLDASPPPPKDMGRPQFKIDQSVKGAGDVADGWLRGNGKIQTLLKHLSSSDRATANTTSSRGHGASHHGRDTPIGWLDRQSPTASGRSAAL